MKNLETTTVESLKIAIASMGGITQGSRTKIGIVRSLFNEIEKAHGNGYSMESILKTMKESGFDEKTTLNHFYGLIHRIRGGHGIAGQKTQTAKVVNQAQAPTTNKTSIDGENNSHEKKQNIVDQKTNEEGIVDIFKIQAEREAKKESGAKFQKIPRR